MWSYLAYIFFIVFASVVLYIVKRQSRIPVATPSVGAHGLLLIAHPDDETMFFGPTILKLLRQRCQLHVLCVSNGNAEGLGEQRKSELFKALRILGLKDAATNCEILNHEELSDGPKNVWDEEKLAGIVRDYSNKWNTKFLITFDGDGVSGHPNHIACFGAAKLLADSDYGKNTRIFTLESVNLLRKYTSALDIFCSFFMLGERHYFYVSSPLLVFKAMGEHRTQLLWFRYFYMAFSRYVVVNTLKLINK